MAFIVISMNFFNPYPTQKGAELREAHFD